MKRKHEDLVAVLTMFTSTAQVCLLYMLQRNQQKSPSTSYCLVLCQIIRAHGTDVSIGIRLLNRENLLQAKNSTGHRWDLNQVLADSMAFFASVFNHCTTFLSRGKTHQIKSFTHRRKPVIFSGRCLECYICHLNNLSCLGCFAKVSIQQTICDLAQNG